jgi:bacteriorhodopsin
LHDFGIVPTVWYLFFFMILELFQNVVFVFMILELFRQCGNFYYNTLLCAINYNLKFIKVDLETN